MPKFSLLSVILAKARVFFSFPSRLTLDASRSPAAAQQGQSSSVMVIIILVIIFAIMIAGGTGMLFSGNEPSGDPWATEAPADGSGSDSGSGSPTASPSASPSSDWSVNVSFLGCNINGIPRSVITSTGPQNGYVNMEVDDGTGKYKEIATGEFLSPQSNNTAVLLNKDGFNSYSWKVNLFSGGTKTSDNWSGGTLQKSYNGNPTGCQ